MNTTSSSNKIHHRIWHGPNIHAYTRDIRSHMEPIINELTLQYGSFVQKEEFDIIIHEMTQVYGGHKVAFSNIRNNYNPKTGVISDVDLPGLNVAILLKATWNKVKSLNDDSITKHFGETLDQIGATCPQGISHRLYGDYMAFS